MIIDTKPGIVKITTVSDSEKIVSVGSIDINFIEFWSTNREYIFLYDSEISKLGQIIIVLYRNQKLAVEQRAILLESALNFDPTQLNWFSRQLSGINTQFLRKFHRYYIGFGILIEPLAQLVYTVQKTIEADSDTLITLGELRERYRWFVDLDQPDLAQHVFEQINQIETKLNISEKFFYQSELELKNQIEVNQNE